MLGICWDVTEHRALESQLRHVQKMDAVGQLAGGIAHDFNNLLTIMLGNLSYINVGNTDPQTTLELVKNAEKAGLRAAELTQTLLGFSRRAALATVPFNLHMAIDEVIRLTRSTLPANIELEVQAEPNLWLVQADPGHMNQVLTNLTLNARDAMPAGGTITYQTSHFVPDAVYLATHVEARPGEYVGLRVSDTGHGVSADLHGSGIFSSRSSPPRTRIRAPAWDWRSSSASSSSITAGSCATADRPPAPPLISSCRACEAVAACRRHRPAEAADRREAGNDPARR